ncbi:MAG: TonB-dependent receptor plug domain-containing protein [Gemmatimonadaceae bacterium]
MHSGAHAQDTTRARRDSLAADSAVRAAARRDSLAADSVARAVARADSIRAARAGDSIKAPIRGAPLPRLADIGAEYSWDRTELFASGALTLNDLLERIPGITTFQSGWIASPQVAALGGDMRAVRVFLDGFELDPFSPRSGTVPDLTIVPLWTLEEVRIERAAGEIRVHLRTWTVRSTNAATRVDVATGDFETNTYRGYYGKRFRRGGLLQLGAYQYATQDAQLGDASHVALIARAGWAKGKVSVAGTYYTLGLDRSEQLRLATTPPRPNLLPQDMRYTQAYARLAYGSADSAGLWAQLAAGSFEFKLTRGDTLVVTSSDSTLLERDTVRTRPQYVAALGYGVGALRLSAFARMRGVRGENYLSPGARASFSNDWLVASMFAERRLPDSLLTSDVAVRVQPLPVIALSGSFGRSAPTSGAAGATSNSARAELGVRLGRAWLSGGVLVRDTAVLRAPVVYDTAFRPANVGRLTGTFAALRGKVFGDLGFDILGIRWDSAGPYRPRYQSRSQIYIDTEWRSAVPSGNLRILSAVTHEYRDGVRFPLAGPQPALVSSIYRTWSFLLEVRILKAVLTYQFRNVLGLPYEQVPGFQMPRQTNLYGVRWEFAN